MKSELIRFDGKQPPIGAKVMRYGMELTREGHGDFAWHGIDSAGNHGLCSWKELFWLGGDSDFVVRVAPGSCME